MRTIAFFATHKQGIRFGERIYEELERTNNVTLLKCGESEVVYECSVVEREIVDRIIKEVKAM